MGQNQLKNLFLFINAPANPHGRTTALTNLHYYPNHSQEITHRFGDQPCPLWMADGDTDTDQWS